MTIKSLVLGLLVGAVVPPVATLALRRRLGPIAVAVASLATTALCAFVLGMIEREPTTPLDALLVATLWQAILSGLLTVQHVPLRATLVSGGALGLLALAIRFGGLA